MGWQRPPFLQLLVSIYKTILSNCLVGQCHHDTHHLTLYILMHQVTIPSSGCAGNKPRRETPVGQLGCDLSDRHSLFSYSGRFSDTLEWFELDIDSQRPTRRLVRRANVSATARPSANLAATSVTVTHSSGHPCFRSS